VSRQILQQSAILGLGLFLIFVFSSGVPQEPRAAVQSASVFVGAGHRVDFFDEWSFFRAVNAPRDIKSVFARKVRGGIVPHHLLASGIIADFFSRLRSEKPDTVILLGPNHEERGDFPALTSEYGWQTTFGLVEPDQAVIKTLIEDGVARADEDALPQEHAVSALMPFLEHYLPQTRVVPVILSRFMSADEMEALASSLQSLITENMIVVSSVDFSHYLSADQAAENDELTLKIIKDFDYGQMLRLQSDFLDSPAAIVILQMVMQKSGAEESEVVWHENSAEFLQQGPGAQTTSYFSIVFHE